MTLQIDPATSNPRLRSRKVAAPPRILPQTALSIVVVNFRTAQHTADLVNRLAAQTGAGAQFDIAIVNNDIDAEPLRRAVPRKAGITSRNLGRNCGFARAVNEGCRIGRGEWILLLNPDVAVPDDFINKIVDVAQHRADIDPSTGVIGVALKHADGTPQSSAGPEPTLWNVLGGMFRRRHSRRCRWAATTATAVPWVTGCCLLVRRACWRELAGFDEDFFLYYEDVDLCRRARANGWSVWYEPSLCVTHFHPLHSRDVEPALRLVTRHALLTYAAKHWPNWQFRMLSRLVAHEARLRAWWSARRGDTAAVTHFQRLVRLTRDLRNGRSVLARCRLIRSARALSSDE